MAAIETNQLTRVFKDRCAVDHISFSVDQGEIFGFLGPNGAGKTTTILMLTGQLQPSSGSACVAGCDVRSESARLKPRIGVVFERQNLYERMTGQENLAFSARLYGVARGRAEEMLEQVGLKERGKDLVKVYSNGMKQRLLLARALLHRPQVLFLDEPTRGLDPEAAQEMRSMIRDLARQGMTVFLTTHYMEEADQLCKRVAFIAEGRIVTIDEPEALKVKHGRREVLVTLTHGEQVHLSLEQPTSGKRLEEMIVSNQARSIHSCEATLEEVYLKLTGRRLV
jgi:ABC-2 type transport system ATP-binding protein